jgi:DNA repair protein RadC
MSNKETTSTNTKNGDEEYKCTGSKTNNPDPQKAQVSREPKNLTTKELLTILISTGCGKSKAEEIALNLLQTFDWNLTDLFTATIHELTQVKGIGVTKACKIQATFELGIRATTFHKKRFIITSTDDVVNRILPHMKHEKQEYFCVVLLDPKNRFIRYDVVSMGSVDSALVHPREVFRPAVRHAASSIILAHNHPSGDPTPSDEDVFMTKKICLCGRIMDIDVLDHVIIGNPP